VKIKLCLSVCFFDRGCRLRWFPIVLLGFEALLFAKKPRFGNFVARNKFNLRGRHCSHEIPTFDIVNRIGIGPQSLPLPVLDRLAIFSSTC
jgi:hypothetical protein